MQRGVFCNWGEGMKCSSCGNEVRMGAKNCEVCGAPIYDFKTPVKPSNPENQILINQDNISGSIPNYNQNNNSIQKSAEKAQKPRKRVNALGAVLLPVICLVIVAAGLYHSAQKGPLGTGGDIPEDRSSTAQVTVTCQEKEKEKEEPKDYTPDIVSTPGTKIKLVSGVIYNDNGGSISNFFPTEYGEGSEFYTTEDESAGVFYNSKGELFYINSDLEITTISDKARVGGFSYNGEYIYYTNLDDGITMYEVKTGETYVVPASFAYKISISPNGQYLAYTEYDSDGNERIMLGGWHRDSVKIADSDARPFAVSNDGNTVFYEDFYGKLSVWNNEHIQTLPVGSIMVLNFNRDCSELIYLANDDTYYFSSKTDEVVQLVEASSTYLMIDAPKIRIINSESISYYCLTDNFFGTFINSDTGIFVTTDKMEVVRVCDSIITTAEARRRYNKAYIIIHEGRGILSMYTCGYDGSISYKHLAEEISYSCFELNTDGSIMWYYDQKEKKVYKVYTESGERKLVYDGEIITHGQVSLKYDAYTDQIFLVSINNESIGIADDGIKTIYALDAADPYFIHYDDFAVYQDKNEGKHVLVFGMFTQVFED